jgi:hypothetical protein
MRQKAIIDDYNALQSLARGRSRRRAGECGSENVSAFLHCDEVVGVEEEDWLVAPEVMSASRETATGHDEAETRSAMVYDAVKITHDVRPDTCNVSLALDDSLETVSCHFYVDAAICRTGRDSRVELMLVEDLRSRPFKCAAIEEHPVGAFTQFGFACGCACSGFCVGLLILVAVKRLPIGY